MRLPALLCIMDGFGLAEAGEGNAISCADKPFIDGLFDTCPHIELEASGLAVGLPEGQMGNSEVGHLNIGAGRVVYQELSRINMAVKNGSLYENQVIREAIDAARASGNAVHFMGLLSDGGVHSELGHLYALIRMAAASGVKDICVHAFLDGRDVPPSSGIDYLARTESYCDQINVEFDCKARVASVSGRFYAMDRDKRWDRVELAWNNLVYKTGECFANVSALIESSYASGVSDEFVVPAYIDGAHQGIKSGDALIFFNFRPDRAREITRAFVDEDFAGFERGHRPIVKYVCLTEYDPCIQAPIAFEKNLPQNVLADVLAQAGLRQYHIAETEKYAHVTFFLNGGAEAPKENEERVLIPSPKEVPTYDLKPQMSAEEVASTLAAAIRNEQADVYIVNFANCDMVGHTGSIPAAIKAVEAVDSGLKLVLEALKEKNGVALITADHGNADKMISDDGKSPHTAHTLAPVPFILFNGGERELVQYEDACLADIAPTLLDIIGLEQAEEWSGRTLIKH